MKTALILVLGLLAGCSTPPKREVVTSPFMPETQAMVNKMSAEIKQGRAQFEKDLANHKPSGVSNLALETYRQAEDASALRRSVDNVAEAVRWSSLPQYTPPVYIRGY